MIDKPKYQNKEWLRIQYLVLKRKISDITKECKITRKTINYWLRKFGFQKRKPTVGNFNNHPTDEKNHNWKGNEVGYHCLHKWVRKRKQKPNSCQRCGKTQEYLELANISGEYKRDINDYIYLCVKCHKEMDGTLQPFIEGGKRTRFRKGHKNELRWGKQLNKNLRIDGLVETTDQSKTNSIIKNKLKF